MVRGGIPRTRAALSLLPPHCRIVASTKRLVASSTVVPMGMEIAGPSGVFDAAPTTPPPVGLNENLVIVSPVASATARWMTCSSSRTLPGHEYPQLIERGGRDGAHVFAHLRVTVSEKMLRQ